jgi:hypothetical protein
LSGPRPRESGVAAALCDRSPNRPARCCGAASTFQGTGNKLRGTPRTGRPRHYAGRAALPAGTFIFLPSNLSFGRRKTYKSAGMNFATDKNL